MLKLRIYDSKGGLEKEISVTSFPCTIGRAETNQVRIQHATVSRQHAKIEKDATGYVIHDMGSSYGTFVDDKNVKVARFDSGHAIRIGSVRLENVSPKEVGTRTAILAPPPSEPAATRAAAHLEDTFADFGVRGWLLAMVPVLAVLLYSSYFGALKAYVILQMVTPFAAGFFAVVCKINRGSYRFRRLCLVMFLQNAFFVVINVPLRLFGSGLLSAPSFTLVNGIVMAMNFGVTVYLLCRIIAKSGEPKVRRWAETFAGIGIFIAILLATPAGRKQKFLVTPLGYPVGVMSKDSYPVDGLMKALDRSIATVSAPASLAK